MNYTTLDVAYKNTVYVCLDRHFALKYGQNNPELDAILSELNVAELCILSADNPYSEIQSRLVNEQNKEQLEKDLYQMDYVWWKGVNVDPDHKFPDEATCWVPGMNMEVGMDKSLEWRQNAFIYYRRGGKADLIWCNSGVQ